MSGQQVSVSHLSASNQNYLKAIWNLGEWSDAPVTAKTLAAKTGVRLSTASDAIKRLNEQGYVEHTPYGAVTLTNEGRQFALAMVRRHRLIEAFLVEALGYRWDQVHEEAESLEHAVSDFMIDKIDALLGHPDRDPHGDPIPTADGTFSHVEAVLLRELEVGRAARIERISDEDPQLLQYLAEHGIKCGTVVDTQLAAPFSDAVEISIDGASQSLPLGRTATSAMWVTPL